jgi:succinate dehydrogenase / fumarate reductase, cytochrome b subunit
MRTRPLSPHLSVYKFMYTMALSILHRITGVALSLGLVLLVYWLVALASGEGHYERAYRLLSHGFIQLLIAGWLLAFAYHLCNGIRHLTWDVGQGLEKHEARRSAFAAFAYLAFFVRSGGAS